MFFSVGCATDKPSIIKKAYHNLTAHYNGYFNGKMTLQEGVKQLKESHKDNYETILDIYPYGDESQASSVFPQMDTTIKKASVVINRHSISKWTDDCYLLIGKANFFKREYTEAADNFQYIITKYKPIIPKRKIFKPFIQKHLRHDAMILLAHNYISNGKFDEAQSILDVAVSEVKKSPDIRFNLATLKMILGKKDEEKKKTKDDENYKFRMRLKGELYSTYALFHLKQNYLSLARENLENALPYIHNRGKKTRYYFIIAQICQQLNDQENAYKYFNKVIKRNPPYEMAFSSKINLARSLEQQSGSTKEVEKVLKKMIHDDKNKEFLDLLYYSLANVFFNSDRTDDALENYKLSVKNSTSNKDQKALSYLKIADIYYNQNKYTYAKAYYDSSLVLLSHDYKNYDDLTLRRENLEILVQNLNTIQLEDSLQNLARLPSKEREKIIENLISKKIEKIEKDQENQENESQMVDANSFTKGIASAEDDLMWYFYNSTALAKGRSDFISKWGNRSLEDNWRRSDKSSFAAPRNDELPESENEMLDSKVSQIINQKESYYKNIPISPEQLTASNEKIIESYFNCGNIYREVFTNFPAAVASFKTLNERFPDNKYNLEVLYNLYRLYDKLSISDSSEYYKSIILKNHPESDYAHIIGDPDYYIKKKKEGYAVYAFYEETYYEYKLKNYKKVIDKVNEACTQFEKNPLKPKFDFLKAISIGKTDTSYAFENALKKIITDHPETDVAIKSKELLDRIELLKNTTEASLVAADTILKNELFKFLPKDDHYYILSIWDNSVPFEEIKIQFSEYIKSHHSMDKLELDDHVFNDTTRFLVVKGFTNQKKVMLYINEINNNPLLFAKIPNKNYTQFCIASENYSVLFKKKVINEYLDFYKKIYIQ